MNGIARRIRWGNLIRIAAIGFAIAAIVAWPQLKSAPLPLPPPPTLPAVEPQEAVTPPAADSPPAPSRPTPSAGHGGHAKRGAKRERIRTPEPGSHAAAPAQTHAPTPQPSAPKPRPEFEPFG